jgi:hypothetical protein
LPNGRPFLMDEEFMSPFRDVACDFDFVVWCSGKSFFPVRCCHDGITSISRILVLS